MKTIISLLQYNDNIIPHPSYIRYIYISTHQYGIHAHLVSRAKVAVCAGEEKGWGVYLLRPRAQCAAGCSMWRAGAVSWPRSARVTHCTYTPSIPPMHQEVTHPHPTTGNMQNYRVQSVMQLSSWTSM